MDGHIASPKEAQTILHELTEEIATSIVGYEETVRDFLTALSANGHILIEGVPGIAKTTLCKSLAMAADIRFGRIQFTQDLLPADITGHNFFNLETSKFEMRKGPVFTELLLADEINRAPPKTQSALLEAMQEKHVTIEGSTLPLPEVFMVVATLNPVETEGVYPLPEAQVDRFMMKLTMGYPSETEEMAILKLKNTLEGTPRHIMSMENILELRKLAFDNYAHFSILAYIRDIARATREVEDLELGLSPRGAIHLLLTAKAHALFAGRNYVIPDDVKAMAHKVIDHRMIISPEAELEGLTASSITESILAKVPVPKEEYGPTRKLKE